MTGVMTGRGAGRRKYWLPFLTSRTHIQDEMELHESPWLPLTRNHP